MFYPNFVLEAHKISREISEWPIIAHRVISIFGSCLINTARHSYGDQCVHHWERERCWRVPFIYEHFTCFAAEFVVPRINFFFGQILAELQCVRNWKPRGKVTCSDPFELLLNLEMSVSRCAWDLHLNTYLESLKIPKRYDIRVNQVLQFGSDVQKCAAQTRVQPEHRCLRQ